MTWDFGFAAPAHAFLQVRYNTHHHITVLSQILCRLGKLGWKIPDCITPTVVWVTTTTPDVIFGA